MTLPPFGMCVLPFIYGTRMIIVIIAVIIRTVITITHFSTHHHYYCQMFQRSTDQFPIWNEINNSLGLKVQIKSPLRWNLDISPYVVPLHCTFGGDDTGGKKSLVGLWISHRWLVKAPRWIHSVRTGGCDVAIVMCDYGISVTQSCL